MRFRDKIGLKLFKGVFGGKPWYKSLTAWGVFIAGVGELYCQVGTELAVPYAAEVCDISLKAGAVLVTLGIRKAATSKNIEE